MAGSLVFLPKTKAGPLFRVFDLRADTDLVGVVYNTAALDWVGAVRFGDAGFVWAEGLLSWSPDEILQNLREAMDTDNLDRATRGLPQREIRRWQMPPTYDPERRRLAWSVLMVPKGGGSPADGEAAYHGFAFGRMGYFHLEIPASVGQFDQIKDDATAILDTLAFIPGKDYGAYTASDPTARRGVDRLFGVTELKRATKVQSFWDDEIVAPMIAGGALMIGALGIGIARLLLAPRRRM